MDPEEKALKERQIYLELAKLQFDAHKNRQTYEWRINFSTWAALGLVASFIVTQKIDAHDCFWGDSCIRALLITAGAALFASYCWVMLLCANNHRKDQDYKQKYANKADPSFVPPPTKPELSGIWKKSATFTIRILKWIWDNLVIGKYAWTLAQILFTSALLTGVVLVFFSPK